MTLNPPPHICGRMETTTPLHVRHARWQWVKEQIAAGHRKAAIGRALGITGASVSALLANGEPKDQPVAAKPKAAPPPPPVVVAEIPRHNVRMPADTVSLARAPWEGDIMAHDPRPETYPRLTLVKQPPSKPSQAEICIAAIRACRDAMRAGA